MILDNIVNALSQTYSIVGTGDLSKVWLEFDTIDECTTGGSATVTKYPTEKGFQVTDYKYRNPDTVGMVGIIADGGLTGFSSLYRRMGKWDRKSAIEAIRKNLDELVGNMTLLTIQTRNAGRRSNMTLTAYEINETYDTFGTMQVTMQFQQVPQFDNSGNLTRNVADLDTAQTGITATQVIAAVGAASLVIGLAAVGNIAAWS